jgi:serine/threonine protein kinase
MMEQRSCRKCGVEIVAIAADGLCPKCVLSDVLELPEATAAGERCDLTETPGSEIGRYKLLEKIGEGGMAVVYMAEQRHPVRRRVAVKVIKLGMDTRQVIARFEAERQALAMMDHPNIAKVFDAGTTDAGRPYFVMELVRGVPITEYCDSNELNARERLGLFLQVCQAVQHAHQKGIIHRDLKPSNILVTLHEGKHIVVIIDFGIAKATGHQLTEKTLFTQYAQMIGTPEYMSPEQAEMGRLDVDTRTDIYSLGVLLYELLTGTTPFDPKTLREAGYAEIHRIIREDRPHKPSTRLSALGITLADTARRRGTLPELLRKEVKGDLDWIVMKCLDADRNLRYDSAGGLAVDIQRHLGNEPIVARPRSTLYRLQKAWRRNRVAISAAILTAVVLVLGTVVSTWQANVAARARHDALTAQRRAEAESQAKGAALKAARRSLYPADIVLAQQSLESGNLGRTHELLLKHRPLEDGDDLRGWEWRYLRRQSQSDDLAILGRHANGVNCVAFSPNGDLIASGSRDGAVKLWDLSTMSQIGELAHANVVPCLRFSNNGQTLATLSGLQGVTLWDVRTKEKIDRIPLDLRAKQMFVSAIAFSPVEDRILALGNPEGEILLWDISSRPAAELARRKLFDHPIKSLSFSSDGKRIAVGEDSLEGGRIGIADANSLELALVLAGHENAVSTVAFSPDNQVLASGGWDHRIILWSIRDGMEIGCLTNHTGWVGEVQFTPDGLMVQGGIGG